MQRAHRDDAPEVYPESDGAPMGESGLHVLALLDLLHQLRLHFAGREDVYVGANQFVYFVEGDSRQVVCPDLFVVEGARPGPPRSVWKTWQETGHFAKLVVEITSHSTRYADVGSKRGLYEVLGVRELVLFDPEGSYLVPPLQVLRLEHGRFEPAPREGDTWWSEAVGLGVSARGGYLELTRADGTTLPHLDDVVAENARLAADRDRLLREIEELKRTGG